MAVGPRWTQSARVWADAHQRTHARRQSPPRDTMLARRRLIDRYRKDQRRPEVSMEPADLPTVNDDVSGRMEISDEATKATRLLNELPPDQANVIELSVYHGLSHSRIAEATGLSLGTVKTNIRRGLSKLRDSLNRSSAKDLSVVKDV